MRPKQSNATASMSLKQPGRTYSLSPGSGFIEGLGLTGFRISDSGLWLRVGASGFRVQGRGSYTVLVF